jgi:heme-degrading monooxygenase HmoA
MHARVSRYHGDVTALRAGFEAIHSELQQLDGFVQAYFLVDEDRGHAISMTMWESEDAMEATEEVAHRMRTRETHPVDVTIEGVGHYAITAVAKPGGVAA